MAIDPATLKAAKALALVDHEHARGIFMAWQRDAFVTASSSEEVDLLTFRELLDQLGRGRNDDLQA
jgi:hypothetical protein